MDAPDTSDIDLTPANIRCRADLWYRLNQLYTKIGNPSYREFCNEILESKGIKLSPATLSDLIGENSKTSTRRVTWDTVKRFVLGCGIPEAELERWYQVWEASEAKNRPTWPEERDQLLAKIDQLTADLTEAKTRAGHLTKELAEARTTVGLHIDVIKKLEACKRELEFRKRRVSELESRVLEAEDALTFYGIALPRCGIGLPDHGLIPISYSIARPSTLDLPEPLERLRIKATVCADSKDYAGAAGLYCQIAAQLGSEYEKDNSLTLLARWFQLEADTEAARKKLRSGMFRRYWRRKFNAQWRQLIADYQQLLPEGDRMTLHLRLDYAYWAAKLLLFNSKGGLSPARKLLIDLYADCQIFLPDHDPFIVTVRDCLKPNDYGMDRAHEEKWSLESRTKRLHLQLRLQQARLKENHSLRQTLRPAIEGDSEVIT